MNDARSGSSLDLVDRIALELQRLRSANRIDDHPLLRVDNRKESAEAPYQFDIVKSVLHRTHCTAIPKRSRTALYALWDVQPDDLKYACDRCRPVISETPRNGADATDLLYGFLAIIDQFGAILSERGKEFRASERGRQMEQTVSRVIDELDQQQQQSTQILATSIDGLIRVLQDIGGNGNAPANGASAAASAPQSKNGNADASRHAPKKPESPVKS
jgi:hypothetical protein